MEVMMPSSPVMEIDMNSALSYQIPLDCPTRSLSSPSTPRRLGDCFLSAPTSPTRLSEFDQFSLFSDTESSRLTIPFDWGTPKSSIWTKNDVEDDFAFDFSAALERTSLSAEELFDDGKIKPLEPPPGSKADDYNQKRPLLSSPRSSPFSQGKKMISEAFSPTKQKATEIESRNDDRANGRGRERVQDFSLKNSSRRAARSLSPYRVSDQWENDDEEQREPTISTKQSLNWKPSSSRKWRLRDLLLFRSASEGRAADKDPLRKYSFLKNKKSSLKSSTDRSGSGGSNSRRKVSAHELHYTTNKAVSENMKKKTFLPYKQTILGRLSFNPAVHTHFSGF